MKYFTNQGAVVIYYVCQVVTFTITSFVLAAITGLSE